ncbi:hypothetical protein PVAP13_6NG133509 [Panicum virgatum]|uniref:BTB domain-containing protein n=1 Tax=Panicum virgatum TaxID=38727 RepID=A0A8T0QXE0_PANVG|nr:hypothetical protein PVAP13_6NG133509 [Panicum virgatum]
MAGNQTIKRIFEVPAFNAADGTLRIWPCFHRSPVFTAGGYEWSISYYPKSIYDRDSIDLCLQLESEGPGVTISSSLALLDPMPSLPLSTVTHWVPKSKLSAPVGDRDSLIFVWAITILTQTQMPVPVPVPEPELMPLPLPEPEPEPEPKMAAMPEVPAEDVAVPSPVLATRTMTDVAPVGKVPVTDVTYSVVLATRSPVFEAELFGGPTSTAEASQAPPAAVEVDDMRPNVFKTLLHYIYTDTLLATEGEAADSYGLEGLKLLCEGTLKDACVGFMVASPERMERVVVSYGYQQLCLRHPLILVDVLEKSLMFRKA